MKSGNRGQNRSYQNFLPSQRWRFVKKPSCDGFKTRSVGPKIPKVTKTTFEKQRVPRCDNQIRRVEAVDPLRSVLRSYKCPKYGHMARNCKNQDTCGKCAERHRTSQCQKTPKESFTPTVTDNIELVVTFVPSIGNHQIAHSSQHLFRGLRLETALQQYHLSTRYHVPETVSW